MFNVSGCVYSSRFLIHWKGVRMQETSVFKSLLIKFTIYLIVIDCKGDIVQTPNVDVVPVYYETCRHQQTTWPTCDDKKLFVVVVFVTIVDFFFNGLALWRLLIYCTALTSLSLFCIMMSFCLLLISINDFLIAFFFLSKNYFTAMPFRNFETRLLEMLIILFMQLYSVVSENESD